MPFGKVLIIMFAFKAPVGEKRCHSLHFPFWWVGNDSFVLSLLPPAGLPWENGAAVSALPPIVSVARQPSSRCVLLRVCCSVCAHAVKSFTATLPFCVGWTVSAHIHILD